MHNRVILHADGIVEEVFWGDQNSATIEETVRQTLEHIIETRDAGKPVFVLVDLTRIKRLSTPARKTALESLKNQDFTKAAIIGTTTFTRALVRLIAYAAGKENLIQVFATRKEAIQWFKDYGE